MNEQMPELKRTFLGWDSPLTDKVRDYLLANAHTETAPDLEDCLVIVPTRQAGRRLREALAAWCNAHDTALLSARIVTPHFLFMQGANNADVAGPVITRAAWINVLTGKDLSPLQALFPGISGEQPFQWALNTGDIIQGLRRELADGAYTIRRVLEKHSTELEELERWQDLAALEDLYLSELESFGKEDLCLAQIEAARKPALDPTIERIIIAGVADPSLLALAALEAAAGAGLEIEILAHADESLADAFDVWGRPLPEYWKDVIIDMPDWQNDIHLETTPAAQAERVLREIAENARHYGAGDIAIGTPDRSVVPFIRKKLGSEGLTTFDPSDLRVGAHPAGLLGIAVAELLQFGSYDTVARLLRHPDFLGYLEHEHSLKSLDVLSQLDLFQNTYLPATLEAMLRPFEDNPAGAFDRRDDFTQLGEALRAVQSILDMFRQDGPAAGYFENAWREVYQRIYIPRRLKPFSRRDDEFESAALAVDSVLREFRDLAGSSLDIAQLSSLFAARLAEATYHASRDDEIIDVEGWLELPWNNRQLLVVTGMNEEFVPGGSMSDAFLPDSLRTLLGLRDDTARLARDVYFMQSMIKSRAEKGRACFVVGKTASSGDPLKPSRLLFRCDDSELPARVEKLLAGIKETSPAPYAEVIFPLVPPREEKVDNYISATSFKSYLECPFRYYLKYVLGMESVRDDKAGLDSMDFGNIVHEVLQLMGEDKKLWACGDPGKLGKHLVELAAKIAVARYGNPVPLPVEISLAAARERLKAAARVQAALVEEGWVIKEVERGGRRFDLNDFTIGGRIDRIDENTNDGRIRIIDYKTFDKDRAPETEHLGTHREDTPEYNRAEISVVSRGKTKDVVKRWADLQLPLYEVLYTRGMVYRENIELAYFALPKAVSRTGVLVWDEFDKARMASAVKCAAAVVELVKKKTFWPPAERVKYENFANMFYFENSVKEI